MNYSLTLKRMAKMFLCCLCMNGGFVVLRLLGFTFSETSRGLALVQMAVYGLVGAVIYAYTTYKMKLPQSIFHIASFQEIFRKILRRGR